MIFRFLYRCQAMLDKGRVSGMLDGVPVYAVLVEDLGERGAHRVAFSDYLHLNSAVDYHDSISPSSKSKPSSSGAIDSSAVLTAGVLLAMGVSLGYLLAKK